MEVAKEVLEGNKVKLKVEIEKERVNDALDKAYRKVVKDLALPGFRKGKVPRRILEARYGKEVLHSDAFDILVPQAYMEAVKQLRLSPLINQRLKIFILLKMSRLLYSHRTVETEGVRSIYRFGYL